MKWIHYLNGALGVCFALCAVLQFNDPDPELWVLIYSTGAMGCFWFSKFGALPKPFTSTLGTLGLVVSLSLFLTQVSGGSLMAQEAFRESMGLGIVSLWILALVSFQNEALLN